MNQYVGAGTTGHPETTLIKCYLYLQKKEKPLPRMVQQNCGGKMNVVMEMRAALIFSEQHQMSQ